VHYEETIFFLSSFVSRELRTLPQAFSTKTDGCRTVLLLLDGMDMNVGHLGGPLSIGWMDDG
jgi:hypothetical protein